MAAFQFHAQKLAFDELAKVTAGRRWGQARDLGEFPGRQRPPVQQHGQEGRTAGFAEQAGDRGDVGFDAHGG